MAGRFFNFGACPILGGGELGSDADEDYGESFHGRSIGTGFVRHHKPAQCTVSGAKVKILSSP
jgi:hypothetical protein